MAAIPLTPGDPGDTISGAGLRQRSASIDALRGVAALAVVGFHALLIPNTAPGGGLARAVATNLDAGVELFFVISGLLIAGPFLQRLVDGGQEMDVRAYAFRRALRILPAYWVALGVVFATGVTAAWWQWGLYAALLQNPVPNQIQAILPVAWTLHVEAVFYVLVPAVAYAVARRRSGARVPLDAAARFVATVWLGSAVFEAGSGLITSSSWDKVFVDSVPATLGLFCPGMLLALTRTAAARRAGGAWAGWRRFAASPSRAGAVALVACVAGITMSQSGAGPVVELRRQAFAIAGAVAVGLVLEGGPRLRRALIPLAPFGVISYSIYLLHWSVLRELTAHGIAPASGLLSYPLRALVLGGITVGAAAVSYLVIEWPAIRYARRRGRRSSSPTAAPVVPVTVAAE